MAKRLTDHTPHRLWSPTRTGYSFNTTQTAMPSGQACAQKTPVSGPGLPVVVYCHGLNSGPVEVVSGDGKGLTDGLAAAGFPVIAPQMHDNGIATLPYANNTVLADIEEAVTYARANMGAAATQRIYTGFSGGGQDALVSAFNHLSDTLCCGLFAPLVDPTGWYNYNWILFNAQTVMDAAYNTPNSPTGGWTANKATRDPTLIGTGFGSLPIKIWYGTGSTTPWNFGAGQVNVDGDTIIPAQTVTTFASAVGANVETEAVASAVHFGSPTLGTCVPAGSLLAFLSKHVTIASQTAHRLVTA